MSADLLTLQGNIKRDADGYKEEFYLQYRHFEALVDIFKLQPSKDSKELGDLAIFVAQVSKWFPRTTADFATHLMALLDEHYMVLEPALRKSLVQALILLRNRNQLSAVQLLPLFFKLFKCQDKPLRQLIFKHIVSDIKTSNKKHRNEKLNRQLQSYLFGVVGDDDEAAAKKALALCTELWRRHVWRDARTVNVIASAAYHKSSRVMLAAVKFFLGQDREGEEDAEEAGGGAREDQEEAATQPKGPSKEDVYKAYNVGTRSSKKKKQAKLKRVMATVKKAERKDREHTHDSFAALHLLHDPQTFAERLFARLQSGNERFEARLALMSVVSRVVGMHKLLLLNFYPFLQKYVAPHTRDVSLVLAALVGAAHELVPPEVLAPVLRQLVDQFVHDRARPEVMVLGLKTTRELCLRCPLIMTPELLQDLVAYKKGHSKEVASAARGLIGLFREVRPELLAKKDRGRGADLLATPAVYGAAKVAERVDGAALLEEALAAGTASEGSDMGDDSDSSSQWETDSEVEGEEGLEGSSSDLGEDGEVLSEEEEEEVEEEEGSSEEDMGDGHDSGDDAVGSDGCQDGEIDMAASRKSAQDEEYREQNGPVLAEKRDPKPDSIASLRKALAEAKERKRQQAAAQQQAQEVVEGQEQEGGAGPAAAGSTGHDASASLGLHIEGARILTEEDFERIRELKHKRLIEDALGKHGLKSTTSKAKRARLVEAAEEAAEDAMELQERLTTIHEFKVDAASLESRKKRGHDKEARLATVLAGREGRGRFGAASGRKNNKQGGLSEREKQRKKALPLAARLQQLRNRSQRSRSKKNPRNFKGHVRG